MEPVTSAVSAAVAATNSSAGKALLEPAFTAFGRYLGERAEEITERWRRERENNINRIRQRVIDVDGNTAQGARTEKQAKQLFDWIDAAGEVDENDENLTSLWASVLSEIYRARGHSELLISTAKKLESRDISFLMLARSKKLKINSLSINRFDRLSSIDLVYRRSISDLVDRYMISMILSVLIYIFAVIAIFFLGLDIFDPIKTILQALNYEYSTRSRTFASIILFLTGLCILMTYAAGLRRSSRLIRLTPFGDRLIDSIDRYRTVDRAAPAGSSG